MFKLILLGISMVAVVFSCIGASANGDLCQSFLQRKLRRLDTTLTSDIDRLGSILSQINTPAQLERYIAEPKAGGQDGRKDFFFIEAYGQILRHYQKGEGIRGSFREIIDESFKVIEDRFGKYTERIEDLEAARAFKLDPLFINYLQGKVDQSLHELFQFMVQDRWIGERANKLREIKSALHGLEWSETKERDHKLFFKALRDTFVFYEAKMNDDLQKALREKVWSYDENMEEGLHEVRRLFRWVMIFMQMRPEAFSYSVTPDPAALKLSGPALEIAKASLEDALARKTAMLDFAVAKPGTLVIRPDSAFFLSGLVDRLGSLKRKSELYFRLQDSMKRFLQMNGQMGPLDQTASDTDIQQFLIDASAHAPSLSFKNIFIAGDQDVFKEIRLQTLALLEPFWKLKSLHEFQTASDSAREYWDDKD